MKKVFIIIGVVVGVLLIAITAFLFSMSNYGPKVEEVLHLIEPRIISKEDTKALVVETIGEPNSTAGPAFGLLFKAYFKLKDVPKGKNMVCPVARWPKPLETPKEQWLGIYAMPVPQTVEEIPTLKQPEGLRLELREWKYGEVAEILHMGPYNTEDTTVVKLKKFVDEKGYEICGAHEEEYLKGPSFIRTSQEKYLTIIRYQVRKKREQSEKS